MSPLAQADGAVTNPYAAVAAARAWLYRNRWFRQHRLRAKVVSIGNIVFGGTGKTPFTIWLAKRLMGSGRRVSILTRGYLRTSPEPVRVIPPGALSEASNDGDEVQLYLRHLPGVPVGIAARRQRAGQAVEERFPVDVHLLDDGFQHLPLARDADIVLVDAQNPWGSRKGMPRLLRETPTALRRASAILITNDGPFSNRRDHLGVLRQTLRALNPGAPQFVASVSLVRLVRHDAENVVADRESPSPQRALGFCAIGTPEHFFDTLQRAGIRCVARKTFRDHHHYQDADLRKIEELAEKFEADCLVTTEKDLMNLPSTVRVSRPLYWADTELEVEEEERLLTWLGERLGWPAPAPRSALPPL
jgi:tetraacyldisaccharide 4'-kinase